jgi:hypothetical protein
LPISSKGRAMLDSTAARTPPDHRKGERPAGQLHREFIIQPLLQQRTRQRRIDADPAQPGIGLIRPDNADSGWSRHCPFSSSTHAPKNTASGSVGVVSTTRSDSSRLVR